MNLEDNPSAERVSEEATAKQNSEKLPSVARAFAVLLAACAMLLFLAENLPSFITFPVSPPTDYYGVADWTENTYAVSLEPVGREYIWRRSGGFSNGDSGAETWKTIVSYFDARLAQQGYIREDAYSECEIYLPEARFLDAGENGYVQYRRRGYKPTADNSAEDFVCLAVWITGRNTDASPRNFMMVLLTVRPSLLRRLDSLL